uniref:LRRNT domain-containing protein n=1 Tax=Branchiostoma floridae TaxID=7739 RepID=C3YIW6_BRAFL|eukprot:XP_002603829.1 hypothetical protein BRAFLDRAFT_101332 [Branchiostoma floridae]
MGRKLRHVLIFLLIILKEPNMPEGSCSCEPSSRCKCLFLDLTSIPQDLPTSIYALRLEFNLITSVNQSELVTSNNLYNGSVSSHCHWYFKRNTGTENARPADKTRVTHTPPLSITSDKPESSSCHKSAPNFPSDVLIGSISAPVSGFILISIFILTIWYKRTARNPPLGLNPISVGSNTNTAESVMTSDHDHQYEDIDNCHDQTGQGQSQAKTLPVKVEKLAHTLNPNPIHEGVETTTNDPTSTAINNGNDHDQAGQGQSQGITEYNTNMTQTGQGQSDTNTTATVVTSGHDQTGQGQSNTNTTATVVTSGHDQTGQGQSNTNTTATVVTSGHDQTGQGQSDTNTTATVVTSGHDQTGQGQSQAITETLSRDARNLFYGSGATVSQLSSLYAKVETS